MLVRCLRVWHVKPFERAADNLLCFNRAFDRDNGVWHDSDIKELCIAKSLKAKLRFVQIVPRPSSNTTDGWSKIDRAHILVIIGSVNSRLDTPGNRVWKRIRELP